MFRKSLAITFAFVCLVSCGRVFADDPIANQETKPFAAIEAQEIPSRSDGLIDTLLISCRFFMVGTAVTTSTAIHFDVPVTKALVSGALAAVMSGALQKKHIEVSRWINRSGPLPDDASPPADFIQSAAKWFSMSFVYLYALQLMNSATGITHFDLGIVSAATAAGVELLFQGPFDMANMKIADELSSNALARGDLKKYRRIWFWSKSAAVIASVVGTTGAVLQLFGAQKPALWMLGSLGITGSMGYLQSLPPCRRFISKFIGKKK